MTDRVDLRHGDCVALMRSMPDCSVDSCITDGPYHLCSVVRRFGANGTLQSRRQSTGILGQGWDGGDISFRVETWAEVCRVLKPGGHLLAFSGARTYHRMAVAIEDAGFEIRDQIGWMFGSGFPKSHSISKMLDQRVGAYVPGEVLPTNREIDDVEGGSREFRFGAKTAENPQTDDAREWKGWGTAIKPAWEPICVARKPLIGTIVDNVLEHRTGAINIDGCRIGGGTAGEGRWPANVIHDGSAEVLAAFAQFGERGVRGIGTAARFFYVAKPSRAERDAGLQALPNGRHPTIKPTDLMAYLCRLVTPPDGLVLDPFMGSGSTGRGAVLEGMRFIGCELSDDYINIAAARIADAEREVVEEARRAARKTLRHVRFLSRLSRQTS
jgi:DNA modification methylase